MLHTEKSSFLFSSFFALGTSLTLGSLDSLLLSSLQYLWLMSPEFNNIKVLLALYFIVSRAS